MARVKNATFSGTTIYDADVDAATFMRAAENIQADAALVYDKLTGLNGEALLIDHGGSYTGAERGSPLGIPTANQLIQASINITSATGTGGAKAASTGWTCLLAVPFFVPTSEAGMAKRLELDFDQRAGFDVRVTTMNTSGTVVQWYSEKNAEQTSVFSDLATISSGAYALFVEVNTDPYTSTYAGTDSGGDTVTVITHTRDIILKCWRMHPNRLRTGPGKPLQRLTTSPYGVTTPSATQALGWTDIDGALYTSLYPLTSYHLSTTNRNLHSLWEYLTGYPAGGNAAYVHEDQDGAGAADTTNPARPRFHGGMAELAGYPDAPQPQFPVHCEAFGAVMSDGYPVVDAYTSTQVAGMFEWQPIIPNQKTKTAVHKAFVGYPDFQTTSSKLKWMVLACFRLDPGNGSGNGPAEWTAYVQTGDGVTVEGSSTFTRIGSTVWAYASGTALDFAADFNATSKLSIEKTGAGAKAAFDEIQLLGWCLYFDP